MKLSPSVPLTPLSHSCHSGEMNGCGVATARASAGDVNVTKPDRYEDNPTHRPFRTNKNNGLPAADPPSHMQPFPRRPFSQV